MPSYYHYNEDLRRKWLGINGLAERGGTPHERATAAKLRTELETKNPGLGLEALRWEDEQRRGPNVGQSDPGSANHNSQSTGNSGAKNNGTHQNKTSDTNHQHNQSSGQNSGYTGGHANGYTGNNNKTNGNNKTNHGWSGIPPEDDDFYKKQQEAKQKQDASKAHTAKQQKTTNGSFSSVASAVGDTVNWFSNPNNRAAINDFINIVDNGAKVYKTINNSVSDKEPGVKLAKNKTQLSQLNIKGDLVKLMLSMDIIDLSQAQHLPDNQKKLFAKAIGDMVADKIYAFLNEG